MAHRVVVGGGVGGLHAAHRIGRELAPEESVDLGRLHEPLRPRRTGDPVDTVPCAGPGLARCETHVNVAAVAAELADSLGLRSAFLGSVSSDVIGLARCPVLVVPPGASAPAAAFRRHVGMTSEHGSQG